jgi:hypothetical protein
MTCTSIIVAGIQIPSSDPAFPASVRRMFDSGAPEALE